MEITLADTRKAMPHMFSRSRRRSSTCKPPCKQTRHSKTTVSANHLSISTRGGGANHGNPLEQAAVALHDVDGSLTGHAGGGVGSTLVSNHPFFFDAEDIGPPGWNARISDDIYSMVLFNTENNSADVRVVTPNGVSATYQRSHFSTHVKTNSGDYAVEFPEGVASIGNSMKVRHYGLLGPTGETVIRFAGIANTMLPQNATRVNGLDNLRNADRTSYEIVGDDVWVKFFSSNIDIQFASTSVSNLSPKEFNDLASLAGVVPAANVRTNATDRDAHSSTHLMNATDVTPGTN